MDTRAQQAEQHKEDLERAQLTTVRLEAQIGRQREEIVGRLVDETQAVDQLGAKIEVLSQRESEVSQAVAKLHSIIAEEITEQTRHIGTIANAVEVVLRKPLYDFPVESGRLETKTEEQVLELAQSLAILRPLVPYPKWRFDADWANPDVAFLLRKRLWEYFNDRKHEGAIVANWHLGTRLYLSLGNDLSRQIYIAGCIDPNEFAFLDRFLRPGMTVLDAGANEGVYTIFAAKRVGSEGSVWAFEPSHREVSRLERNLDLNKLSARVFPVALADSAGEAELAIAAYGHEGLNTLGAFVHDIEAGRKERVQVARLDDVVNQNPPAGLDMIKIDVEGAELRLLKGATATLQRYRPIVLLEVSDAALRQQGSSREELLDYLRAHGYEMYLFDPYSGFPSPAIPGAYSDNMIAAPAGISLPDAVYRPWPETGNESVKR